MCINLYIPRKLVIKRLSCTEINKGVLDLSLPAPFLSNGSLPRQKTGAQRGYVTGVIEEHERGREAVREAAWAIANCLRVRLAIWVKSPVNL